MKRQNFKSIIFIAVLIGFPVSNVLIFLWSQFYPGLLDDGPIPPVHANKLLATGHTPHANPEPTGLHAEVATTVHDHGRKPSAEHAGANTYKWTLLEDYVSTRSNFKTFEAFYNSGSQSWRIQKYGRVCIVSDDFLGAVVSSGVGTQLTALAELLATSGFEVTLLYTRGQASETATIDFWVQYYGTRGIRFIPMPNSPVQYDVPVDIALSHRVYIWLQQQVPFDIIHFADSKGRAYFPLVAKKQGIGFQRTQIVVHAHSPHIWFKINSWSMLDTVQDLVLDYMEHQTALMAEAVVCPTHYMLSWVEEQGWNLAKDKVFVHPNIIPTWVQRQSRVVMEELVILEIVFFGRLELRKGLVMFCDALDRLSRVPADMEGIKVSFLGRISSSAEEKLTLRGGVKARTDEYIKQRSRQWKFPWQVLRDMDAQARVDYMHSGSRLAVMPSIMENSPYTAVECLVAGIPFIATDVGGVHELIHPDDVSRVLVQPNAKRLAQRLQEVLRHRLLPARPVPASGNTEKTWAVWHHMLVAAGQGMALPSSLQQYNRPLVSVCIVTFNNPTTLKQALISVEEQDYPNVEVVLVDDGSTQADAQQYLQEVALKFATRGWKYARQENRGPGAARNHAATLARGEFLLFMDDDNYAKQSEISTFVSVADRTGADVLTCSNDYFFGNEPPGPDRVPTGRWVPLGAAKTVGMFQNMYGDTNAMIRKHVFHELGGFPEDWGYALEDWELFSKAVLAGYNLQTIPEPLYWYRLREASHSRVTARQGNSARTIRPYLRHIPQNLHHLVLFAQGMKESHDVAHNELASEQDSIRELRKMLKALASSLSVLCKAGKLPSKSRNLLQNPLFSLPGNTADSPAQSWKPYGLGYIHDHGHGRMQSVDHTDAYCVHMLNADTRDARGATQQVVLDQPVPSAVVVSGWSRAEKVSGSVDSGYAIYIDIAFKDGTKLWGYTINFDVGSHDWQFKAGVIDPDVAIYSLQVYVMFRWHSGAVWFDDLAVNMLTEGLCDYTQLTLQGLANHN
eukprot:jgi/Mesvir1/15193/Mv06430-RA.1